MKIIPAIDIIEGKCVRLTKGDFSTKKIYNENPIEVAKAFQDVGIKQLHIVDLDAAKTKTLKNKHILEDIKSKLNLKVDYGGGVTNRQDLLELFSIGIEEVTLGSIAIKEKYMVLEWLEEFGNDRLILGADCLNRKIVTNAWDTLTQVNIEVFIEDYFKEGFSKVIVTDISKDGMLQGPAFELYADILKILPIKLIASGGVKNIEDILHLSQLNLEGVIIGKAIYEGNITLKDLSRLC